MKRLTALALMGCSCITGCAVFQSPIDRIAQLLETEAGQKLVDKMEFQGEADLFDPGVGVYWVTGFEMRSSGVRYHADVRASGEVGEDERGFAPRVADTQPVP